MTKLTTEFLSKLQDNLLQFQNSYSDPADKENYDIFVDALHVLDEFKAAKAKLLAYEQAAKNPVAWVVGDEEIADFKNGREVCVMRDCDDEHLDYLPLYAAPVLPKQPESEIPFGDVEQMEVTDDMVYAFHNRLSDGSLTSDEFTDIKQGLCAALMNIPRPAQPVIPEQTEREQIRREHAVWSDATFGNVGPVGPLKHLSKEALEAAAAPDDLLEWADMQFLLWDAQRRMGIPDDFITIAMIEKLEINKKRQWPKPKDGEPRLHINTQSAQLVSEPYKLPVGYFSYGSECGFDWHNTEKEAIEAAEAVIDDYRGDACDGWSEETDSVCWGVILQQATKVDERPRTDDDKCDQAIDTVCDYALLPSLESK